MATVLLLSSGTTSPTRWAYTHAHNLRNHGYDAQAYSWFSVLTFGKVRDFVERFVTPGCFVCVADTYVLAPHDVHNFKILYAGVKAKGGTVILTSTSVNREQVIPYDVNISGRYKENELLDYLNYRTGRIKKIPYDFYSCDFVWRKEDNFVDYTVLPVEISRHCVFDCKFCAYPNRGAKSAPNRDMSLIRAELDSAYNLFGTKWFSLMCSTFNDSKSKLDNFFQAISGTDYEFAAFIRLDLLMKQKEYWPMFKKHIRHMCFGIDTLNHETGKVVGKGTNPVKVKEWLYEVKEYFHDCLTYSCFILGMPHFTLEEGDSLAEYLKESRILDGYHFNPLGVMHPSLREYSSNFDLEVEKYGYTRVETSDMWGRPLDGWIRDDGLSYDDVVGQADYHNKYRESAPLPFTSIMLAPYYSMEYLKNTRVKGTPGMMNNIVEYREVFNLTREVFWDNVFRSENDIN